MKTFRLLFCIAILLFALNNYAAESWRTHLMYSSVTQVAETPTKVYGIAASEIFCYDKITHITSVLSRSNGLSDNKISVMKYSSACALLIVIYENSNIDLIYDNGTIFNIPDIKNKTITSNKSITKINIYNNTAYLSCSFGFFVLDLPNKIIKNCYNIKRITYAIAEFKNIIYAATNSGIYTYIKSTNPLDPNNWILYNNLVCSDLEVFNEELVGLYKNVGLYKIKLTLSEPFFSNNTIYKIETIGAQLIIATPTNLTILNDWSNFINIPCQNLSYFSTLKTTDQIWTSNQSLGLNKLSYNGNNYINDYLNIIPKGPIVNSPYKLKFSGNKLIITGGGAWADRYGNPAALYFFENETWSSIKTDTINVPGGARDFICAIEDPNKPNHYFVTTYGEGLYEFENNKLKFRHNYSNSGIETVEIAQNWPSRGNFDRAYGITYDKDLNIYITNNMVANSIKVFSKDRKWFALNYPVIAYKSNLFDIIQLKNGQFWSICVRDGSGVFVFDVNSTPTEQADDSNVFFETLSYEENNYILSIKPNNYFAINEDKKGAIWLGTENGIVFAKNTNNVFNTNFLFCRPKAISSNGIYDYLLNNIQVRAIDSDAGNRKWLGTLDAGVFLVNEDGTKIIKHFTYENSPLLSNKILSIAIHPTTGEVFIGTDKGLISYTNDAVDSKKNFSEVYAYPNPLKPEFEEDITITGLKAGADIRILNSGGNTVFEGKCETDEIVWSGKDSNNNRVDTGVYTVYAAVPGSLESMVTRIFIIK